MNGREYLEKQLESYYEEEDRLGRGKLLYRHRETGTLLVCRSVPPGEDLSAYRRLGREVIRLHVSTENPRAKRFYEKYRFRQIGETEGAVAPLLLMEMKL